MNKKREISQEEADALIDQYLANKDNKNIGENKDTTSKTKIVNTNVSSDFITKNNDIDLVIIASKGYRAVIDEVEELGKCARSRKLLSMYNTKHMDTYDFMEYLITLVRFSAFDEIKKYVNNIPNNPNANFEDLEFLAKGMFENFSFKSMEDKNYVKNLLRL